jgi:hypothetical protein
VTQRGEVTQGHSKLYLNPLIAEASFYRSIAQLKSLVRGRGFAKGSFINLATHLNHLDFLAGAGGEVILAHS